MIKGTVKWFSDDRGYGFIVAEGKEYFVHYKDINCPGFKTLKEGFNVEFEGVTSQKGITARNVTVIR